MKSFDLSGKTALVTGCKRGIGFAMAQGLAEAGANIIGVSASLELHGSSIEPAVTALGQTFTAYQCDFSKREEVKSFTARLLAEQGVPDILVNNAGTIKRIPAGRWGDPEDFKGPIVFLASEASRYVHGEILVVDGGWMGR
jgi:2-deoxy-D-gluconate 3-dehydrogenase